MDDSSSPSPSTAGMYWSVEECRWVASPVEVTVPAQREDEPAVESATT